MDCQTRDYFKNFWLCFSWSGSKSNSTPSVSLSRPTWSVTKNAQTNRLDRFEISITIIQSPVVTPQQMPQTRVLKATCHFGSIWSNLAFLRSVSSLAKRLIFSAFVSGSLQISSRRTSAKDLICSSTTSLTHVSGRVSIIASNFLHRLSSRSFVTPGASNVLCFYGHSQFTLTVNLLRGPHWPRSLIASRGVWPAPMLQGVSLNVILWCKIFCLDHYISGTDTLRTLVLVFDPEAG